MFQLSAIISTAPAVSLRIIPSIPVCGLARFVHELEVTASVPRIDNRFPMLCVLVKRWARASGINSSRHGTFSRFVLIVVVTFWYDDYDLATR